MISYAQNAEDVVLARVLPARFGFYVDVGAADPDDASVTRHFYDLGWSGINVEPRREAVERLRQRRPRDVNLHAAAGASDGQVVLHRLAEDPDLSTVDADHLDNLPPGSWTATTETVPLRTLDGILAQYARAPVDFVKIDAEGSEDAVLAGLDLARWRPRVVVVEAVKPWRSEREDERWRWRLETAGYRAALFDGINLFFAPADEADLLSRLAAPASALDGYVRHHEALQADEIERLRGRIAVLHQTLEERSGRGVVASRKAMSRPLRAPRPPAGLGPRAPVAGHAGSPPPPAGVVVVGAPGSAGGWLADALAAAVGGEVLRAGHPGDVDWGSLPERPVLHLPWGRTRLLERTLAHHRLVPLCLARHPIEVLVEAGPRQGWTAWALGPEAAELLARTSSWWATPLTCRCRYEHLLADHVATLASLLDELGLEAVAPLAGPPPPRSDVPSPGTDTVAAVVAAHRDLFARLGYAVAGEASSAQLRPGAGGDQPDPLRSEGEAEDRQGAPARGAGGLHPRGRRAGVVVPGAEPHLRAGAAAEEVDR